MPNMGIGGGRCRGRTEESGGDEGALSFPEEIEEVVVRACLIAGTGEESYAEVGAELGMSREAVKKAVQRMRHRYYELCREEVAHTMADPAEVEEELRYLCAVIEA